MRRRILLLITDLELGGSPAVVRELAIRLHRMSPETSAEVEVACLAPWGPVASQIEAAGVRVTALGARGALDLRVLFRLRRLIRRGDFDTVFSFLVHANVAAAAVAIRRRNVRFFQSIQTTQPRPRWHWRVQGIAQHAAERIAAPSESVAAVARDWSGVPQEKLVVIPNAIEPAEFTTPAAPWEGAGPFPVGFIGRLDPIKRIPDLLEAMQVLGDRARLTIFGAGEQREFLEGEIGRLGLAGRASLFGPIARAQEALAGIGVLVLPSEAEGFGLVLIEAMAAAVPVVATDVPGIRDVVRDGQTGLLVPVGRPTELAGAIKRVIEDRGLRERLVANALADVKERFSWEGVIPQYLRFLGIDRKG